MKKKGPRGLFDEQFRLDKLSGQKDPLQKLRDPIDFEFFGKPLEAFLAAQVPDTTTIWNYKNQLAQAGMMGKLFQYLDKQLDKDGIIAHKGKMIDASFVEVPRQCNGREENNQLKEGEIPETCRMRQRN